MAFSNKQGRIGAYVPGVSVGNGRLGADIFAAAVSVSSGGGGGGGGGGNSIRAFPEPNTGRFFPTNGSRSFPIT